MSLSPKAEPDIFDPADFYAFASWLNSTKPGASSQALRRTIVGRAYYAALICARDATKTSTSGLGGHKNVVTALKQKNHTAGSKLDELRLKRHKADYESDELTPREVEIALKAALVVLQALGKFVDNSAPFKCDYLDPARFLSVPKN